MHRRHHEEMKAVVELAPVRAQVRVQAVEWGGSDPVRPLRRTASECKQVVGQCPIRATAIAQSLTMSNSVQVQECRGNGIEIGNGSVRGC